MTAVRFGADTFVRFSGELLSRGLLLAPSHVSGSSFYFYRYCLRRYCLVDVGTTIRDADSNTSRVNVSLIRRLEFRLRAAQRLG
jgi:hypothetical protein